MFDNIENVLCDELDKLDEKYRNGQEINAGDLQKADMIFHALKSAATYKAMKGSSEYDGYRRSRMGSRDMGREVEHGREYDPYWNRR